ncbi:MAG: hypothetical protein AB1499_13965 [Nitrospirota bacterium]
MKFAYIFLIVLALLSGVWYEVSAWRIGRPVTPYGDFCPACTKYGSCKTIMTHDAAKKAMIDYYRAKGLNVELEKKSGRFIRAKIIEENRVIDVIIFDRQTGRVRSIY